MRCTFFGRLHAYRLDASSAITGEVLNLHIGQAGCQVGTACWEMFCMEHKVRPDGIICPRSEQDNLESFFSVVGGDKVVPRASFIDLEPSTIDEIRMGQFREFFDPNFLLSGKEDASNCFPRGYFTLAKDMLGVVTDRIRLMAEDCNAIQGFLLYRAYGGGTGSGLGARILEKISRDYPKCNIFEFSIYPAPKMSSVIVEPYNTALSIHESLEYTSGSFVIDNEAACDICDRLLDLNFPSYSNTNINRLLGQVVSGATASFRYEGNVNMDFSEMKTNLIPFPRVQYAIISYAPLISRKQALYENITEGALLNGCFERSNQFVKCDVAKGKYMACTVHFRGDICNSSVNAAIASIKAKKSINFVDWCPTGFKVGVNGMPPVNIPGGDLAETNRVCLMIANSTAIKTVWTRINRKFDALFSKKSFLHWFIAEGLEEGDFQETRLDLAALECDYLEVELNK